MAGWSGDTILGSRSWVWILQRMFFLWKKSSLPGGQLQYSLQRTVGGGALGLAADLPARIVSSAFVE